jgi:hypothetical protein
MVIGHTPEFWRAFALTLQSGSQSVIAKWAPPT